MEAEEDGVLAVVRVEGDVVNGGDVVEDRVPEEREHAAAREVAHGFFDVVATSETAALVDELLVTSADVERAV